MEPTMVSGTKQMTVTRLIPNMIMISQNVQLKYIRNYVKRQPKPIRLAGLPPS